MKFPEFIIIGTAKCGTTPLWFNADKHPDITMSPRRLGKTEMHFWGTSNYKNKGIDWYKNKFKGKVSGEKTPTYIGNRRAIAQMKKHIPDVKLVLCVRNPVDRAYSNYRMNLKAGRVGPTFTYNLFRNRYAIAGKYIVHLRNNVLPFFSKDQIHICVTERMKKNTVEEMNRLYNFLGLESIDVERRVVDVIRTFVESGSRNMEVRRKESWYRVWDQYSTTVEGKLRKQMLAYYQEVNQKLFDYLGYPIKEWKK